MICMKASSLIKRRSFSLCYCCFVAILGWLGLGCGLGSGVGVTIGCTV